MRKVVYKNNHAVVIHGDTDQYWANLYVNIRSGIELADITPIKWKGCTLPGAERWASKQLEKA